MRLSSNTRQSNALPFLCQEDDEEAERTKLREVSKRLYAQLQEVEAKHQEEKDRLQVTEARHTLLEVTLHLWDCET